MWNEYAITLRHDAGVTTITTWADRMTQAVRQVLDYERAPFRAVVKIRKT